MEMEYLFQSAYLNVKLQYRHFIQAEWVMCIAKVNEYPSWMMILGLLIRNFLYNENSPLPRE